MRILGILTSFQEEVGMRLVEVHPKVYELRNPDGNAILINVGEIDRKHIVKEANEFLRSTEWSKSVQR